MTLTASESGAAAPAAAPCVTCGEPVPAARIAIGKTHCTARVCVGAWRRKRLDDGGLRLMLQPKVGLQWVADAQSLTYGRSSGR